MPLQVDIGMEGLDILFLPELLSYVLLDYVNLSYISAITAMLNF